MYIFCTFQWDQHIRKLEFSKISFKVLKLWSCTEAVLPWQKILHFLYVVLFFSCKINTKTSEQMDHHSAQLKDGWPNKSCKCLCFVSWSKPWNWSSPMNLSYTLKKYLCVIFMFLHHCPFCLWAKLILNLKLYRFFHFF